MADGDTPGDPDALRERIHELAQRVNYLESFLDENFPARWRTKRRQREPIQPTTGSDPSIRDAAEELERDQPTFTPPDEGPARDQARPARTRERGTLESRIGGNLLGKAGVLVLVLGLAFFVAYAIESGLIGLRTRIILGVLGGLGVWWGGHQLRNHRNYGRLAQVFAGGGVALAYFSIFAAHHFDTYQALFGIGLLADSLLLAILAAGVTVYSIQVESSAFLLESLLLGFVTAFLAADLTLFTLTYTTLMALGVSAAALIVDEPPVAWMAIAGTYAHALLTGLLLEEFSTVLTAITLDAIAFGAFAVLSTHISPGRQGRRATGPVVVAPILPSRVNDESQGMGDSAAAYGMSAILALASGTIVSEAGNVLADGRYPLFLGLALLAAAAALWNTRRRTATVSGLVGYAGVLVAAPLGLEAQVFLMAWAVAYIAAGLVMLFAQPEDDANRLLLPTVHVVGLLLLLATLNLTGALGGAERWVSLGSVSLAYGIVYAALARVREKHPEILPWDGEHDPTSGRAAGLHLYAGVLVLTLLLFLELTAIRITLALGILGVALVAWGFLASWPEPRWSGLAVLGLALAKAFLYDVWQLTLGLRVVAFVGLGLALVAAAIAYARYGDELTLGGS